MQAKLIKFIASTMATILGVALLVTGIPTASNAEGVANYLYKCDPPTTQAAYVLYPGTPLTTCDNAYILVYHNGSLIDRYQTDNAGIMARGILSDTQTVFCVAAVGVTAYGVLTGTGLVYKRVLKSLFPAIGVVRACKA